MEEAEDCRVWLNGEEIALHASGWFVDPAIVTFSLPHLQTGENSLEIQIPFRQKSNLENIYLLGNFDVLWHEKSPVLSEPGKALQLIDITSQGMPFYIGNLLYHFEFMVEERGGYFVRIPDFRAPLLSVQADGGETRRIAYAPHRASLGTLEKGTHDLTVRLYGNRFNAFGTLHNCSPNYTWYGPDSFRTTGENWSEDYCLRPVGILGAVEIQKKQAVPDRSV